MKEEGERGGGERERERERERETTERERDGERYIEGKTERKRERR